MSNGNGRSKIVIEAEQQGPGWILFKVKEAVSDPSLTIHHCLMEWLKERGVRVRTTLPIVTGGMTVAVHLWYDGSEEGA